MSTKARLTLRGKASIGAGRALARLALPAAMAMVAVAASGQTAYLVKDLPQDAGSQIAVQPYNLLTVGNRVFFFGNLGTGQIPVPDVGLWASDGTAAGTQPLATLCADDCTNQYVGASGSSLFLSVGTDNGDHVLWRTDGTLASTIALTPNGPPVRGASYGGGPLNHAFLDGSLFFLGCPGVGCDQLWRTDGTVAGTTLVGDFSFDDGLVNHPQTGPLVVFGDKLYFLNPQPGDGSDGSPVIWRSDGTSAGTAPLPWAAADGPAFLTPAAGQLFFLALDDQLATRQLWVTDGNRAAQPFTSFTNSHAFDQTSWLKPVGGRVYFLADDGTHGEQLWASDGTAAGTVAATGLTGVTPLGSSPDLVQPVGSRLIFFAGDPPSLWATSGTPSSTVPLCPPGGCGPLDQSAQMWQVGGRLVVLTGTVDQGYALWSTDGTATGTVLLKNLCSSSFCFANADVTAIGSRLYFQPDDGVLWQTDGTVAGTKPYANGIVRNADSLSPLSVASLSGRLLFNAPVPYASQQPDELWVSDGTAAGTHVLTAGAEATNPVPGGFLTLGDLAFFSVGTSVWQTAGSAASTMPVPGAPATASPLLTTAAGLFFTDGVNLWRTDGTALGTRQLTASLAAGQIGPQAAFQGKLFFAVYSTTTAVALWQSDGTAPGTVKAFDLPPFPAGMQLDRMWSAGSFLFYTGIDRDSFIETLWRSDGTAAGTIALARVPYEGDPELTAVGDWVYFVAYPGATDGAELWRTDGTAAGTGPVLAGSQPLNANGGTLTDLTAMGGELYLLVGSSGAGTALWRSDGTAAGTFPVHQFADPDAGDVIYPPRPMVTLGSFLVFAVNDQVHGLELWTSDGTAAGTALLRDINPGPAGSQPSGLAVAAGKLFFSADDGVHGPELWESDGTTAGTHLVQDIWPGPAGSSPSGMTQAGNLLYFTADDGLTGTQLWALPLTGAAPCVAGTSALCLLGNRFKIEALWQDPQGDTGAGQAVALTPDTGYFWFFSPDSVEVIAKVIDGRPLNDSFWFFYGALSNVEYWLTVTDTATGAVRRYLNPQGQLASVGDTTAFGPQGAFALGGPVSAGRQGAGTTAADRSPAAEPAVSAGTCTPAPHRLCLGGNRFAVTVAWQDFTGHTGNGNAVDLTSDTGSFWFFDSADVELVLKVLDGRTINGKFWVFFGALSDVAYTVTVRDTVTGSVRTYTNPAGQFASVADTAAF